MSSLRAVLETLSKEELVDRCENLLYINKKWMNQSYPDWIRVADALPDTEREVLRVTENGYISISAYINGSWEYFSNFQVTHWMELPEAPKDEI